jgi:hypothetical protein
MKVVFMIIAGLIAAGLVFLRREIQREHVDTVIERFYGNPSEAGPVQKAFDELKRKK